MAVNDVAECTRYFVDFGLPLLSQGPDFAHFRLEEGSNVFIRHIEDKSIPQSCLVGTGVCEVTWGVDRQESLDALVARLTARSARSDRRGWVGPLLDG